MCFLILLFVVLLVLWVKCVCALMHGKTRTMSFLGFDPLSLLPVQFSPLSLEARFFLGTVLLTCKSQERDHCCTLSHCTPLNASCYLVLRFMHIVYVFGYLKILVIQSQHYILKVQIVTVKSAVVLELFKV